MTTKVYKPRPEFKLTRLQAIRVFCDATSHDDPYWDNLVGDYYDEDSDTMPTMYDVLRPLGISKDEADEAMNLNNPSEGFNVSVPATREDFEAWASEPPRALDLFKGYRHTKQGRILVYADLLTQRTWEAVQWAGARTDKGTNIRDQIMQAICDELPDDPEHERTVCINYETLYHIVSEHLCLEEEKR